jgi:anti-sigma B factor antagonist
MNVRTRVITGVTILHLEGRLVTQSRSVPSLRSIVRDQVRQGRLVVLLDMSAVTDIDAHGLGALVSSLTTLERHGGQMALIAPSDRIRRLLAITRLDTVFAVYESEPEALVRCRPTVAATGSWADSAVVLDGNGQSEAARPVADDLIVASGTAAARAHLP